MLNSRDVLNINFTTTQLRRGYDEREVDEFLDRVVETLRHYEAGGAPVDAPDPGPFPASRTLWKVPSGDEPKSFGRRLKGWVSGDPE